MEFSPTVQKVLTSDFPYTKIRTRDGITTVTVKNQQEGFAVIKKVLPAIIDRKTVVYLSGGKTPKELYSELAKGESLQPAAVGLIDERYGEKFHENSNERLLKESGLLRYFDMTNVPFYPILQDGLARVETAIEYDNIVRMLSASFPKSIGILGIGMDGHTAGIPVNLKNNSGEKSMLVTDYDYFPTALNQRISMTFLGLSMIDYIPVLVFGKEKKEALQLFFSDGSKEEVPSRFLREPDMAKKVLLITDVEL